MAMLNPPHPGDFIRTEIIEANGLSVTEGASVLGVARPTLSSLLNGKSDLSGDMALRIEKAFGVKMDTLMRMQNSYDISRTRKRTAEIKVRRFRPPAANRRKSQQPVTHCGLEPGGDSSECLRPAPKER